MRIDAFYSRKWLSIKLAAAVLIPVSAQVFSLFVDENDTLLSLMILMFISALLYAVPFIATLSMIRSCKVKKAGRYILWDAATLLAPSVLSCVMCEVVEVCVSGANAAAGAFVIIFGILYSLISLVFWGLYLINAKLRNK